MIGVFCLGGAMSMSHVIYYAMVSKIKCARTIKCPTREVVEWRYCDIIPDIFCRAGLPVARELHVGFQNFARPWVVFSLKIQAY